MKKYFKIEANGWGGETVMGIVSQEQYDYWIQKEQKNQGAIGEYFSAFESDPENTNKNVPEKSRFNCSWFELDNVVHTNGPEISDENVLEIIETDKDQKEINREKFSMEMDLLDSTFKLQFEDFGPDHDKVKGKHFFLGQAFEKGVWESAESGMGLIETDESGLNKKNLNFHIIEVYGIPTCCAVSYNDKKYDLIGNTRTQSSSMNLYKGK
jgi:hypothetical protein